MPRFASAIVFLATALSASCSEPVSKAEAVVVVTPNLKKGAALTETFSFLGELDAPRIRSLREQSIQSVEKGKGGRSLAFKITLADGTQGYFKPEQSLDSAYWYAEIAAYYLDRMLMLGRVAPTTGRVFPWEPLRVAAANDERIEKIVVRKDGTVRGAFIWWIPERLKRLRLGRGWERSIRMQPLLPITPFQRPADFRADIRGEKGVRETNDPNRPLAGKRTFRRAREISDMVLFDYLTQNVDRWGGDFTNIRTRGVDGPLIYLDNGAAFWWGEQRLGLMKSRLRAVQRFSGLMIEAVQQLDFKEFVHQLNQDPLTPILNDRQLQGLQARRKALLQHFERMSERFGHAEVLPW